MRGAASTNGAVDIHAHAMPLPVLEWLESNGLADLGEADRNVVRIDPKVSGVRAGAPLPLASSMTDPVLRLAEMDATGVAIEAVSLPPFLLGSTSEDTEFVSELVRRGNDALEEYCAAAPDRLVALSSLPVGTPDALAEAQRCLEERGARGVSIGSRGNGCELDDSVNSELWAYLAERRTFVFLHPSATPEAHRLGEFWFPQLVGYPMETAIAVARLVFSGVLERSPLTLCLAHGGGCLPALRGRLDMGWERKEVAHTTAAPPHRFIDGLYYDTAVFEAVALARLVEDVGAEHVLLGTDHPFDLAERDPVGFIRSAHLSAAAEALVLRDNALNLLGLP
jgi:aminocarboxymuconate-semialdehyde decarboxylase